MSDEPSDEELLALECQLVYPMHRGRCDTRTSDEKRRTRRVFYNAGKEAGRASMQRELEEAECWWRQRVEERDARIAALEAGQVNAAVEMLRKKSGEVIADAASRGAAVADWWGIVAHWLESQAKAPREGT